MIRNSHSKKPSLKVSLIRSVGLLVILPLFLVIVFLGFQVGSQLTKSTIESSESFLQQIATNDDQLIEIINYATSMLIVNRDTLRNLRTIKTTQNPYEHYVARTEISRQLEEIESSIMNAVNGKIAIITDDGYLIGSSNLSRADRDYSSEEWYLQTLQNGRRITFHPAIAELISNSNESYSYEKYRYLYYARSIQSYSGSHLGVVVAQISANKIWDNYLNRNQDNVSLFIVDVNGNLQACSFGADPFLFQTLEVLPDLLSLAIGKNMCGTDRSGFFYNAIRLVNSPHVLIYMQPANEMYHSNKVITTSLWVATILITLLILFVLGYISKKISTPLSELGVVMNDQKENPIPTALISTSFQEMDSFIDSYNHAWNRVSLLMDQIREETHLREKAYYELLISQISPHFISNTVNSIKVLANSEKAPATVEALDALGDILHFVYNNSSDLTIIAQELQLLSSYVKIMRMRFGYTISYIENIPTELYMCEIPAFTLQPLVENAFIHGVHEKQAGQIIVNAEGTKETISISIFNNGNIADIEKIHQALSEETKEKKQIHWNRSI